MTLQFKWRDHGAPGAFFSLTLVLGAALGLTGCQALTSDIYAESRIAETRGHDFGSYFLPRHDIVVKVSAAGALTMETVSVRDNGALVKLGYAGSPTSDDDIKVVFEDGLLKSVTTTLDDRTDGLLPVPWTPR